MMLAKKNGFGLIEVLIASTIIVTILAALVSVGRMTLRSSVATQQRAVAMQLAQEGIEIVREMRDTNWVDGDNATEWNSLVNSGSTWRTVDISPGTPKKYQIKYIISGTWTSRFSLSELTQSSDPGEKLTIDGSDFTRKIILDRNTGLLLDSNPGGEKLSDYYLKVTSEVITPDGKTISASEIITNWRPNY